MNNEPFSITAIMPIYNEEASLKQNFFQIISYLNNNFLDYELIIIESGSTDGSGEFLELQKKEYKNIKLIREETRNGFGSAVRLGIEEATKELICILVIDLPYDFSYLTSAIQSMNDVDFIISYRSCDERPLQRRMLTFIYDYLVRLLFNIKVKNVNSALKVFRTSIIKNLRLQSCGWTIDIEILIKLFRSGYRYKVIPVPCMNRTSGSSTIRTFTPFKVFIDLLKLKYFECIDCRKNNQKNLKNYF